MFLQQQKKKRDTRKGRRKKDADDDGEEKELMQRLQKLSVPASDEEDEGEGAGVRREWDCCGAG